MTDLVYILSSLTWAAYGLIVGMALGVIADIVWADHNRR